jgi:hypothetical protein
MHTPDGKERAACTYKIKISAFYFPLHLVLTLGDSHKKL